MKTVSEIYQYIAETINSSINEDWYSAWVNIKISKGYIKYDGDYIQTENDDSIKSIDIFEFPMDFDEDIKLLHQITTEGGINKWNKGIFKLWEDGRFDMEFIWDQDYHDEVEKLNKK